MPEELVQYANPFPLLPHQESVESGASTVDYIMLNWLVTDNTGIPPYWSRSRDRWLRDFMADNGSLKTAVATFINKAVTIPFSIIAVDSSMTRDVKQAQIIQDRISRNSGSLSSSVNKGFKEAFKMFTLDYLTQDNGAFMLVLGQGDADGPISGPAVGILHLDSARCTRTKNPEFPVLYHHEDGKLYKLHWTRIIEMANVPSADSRLNGVGLCAVSCCVEAAQELWDIYRFSAEKFGSRPPRQILYAKKGATVANLETAIRKWSSKMENDQRTHFGGTMLAAPRSATQELDLELLDLSSVPDGFNRRDVTTLNKAEIAAAFGLDLRDLAFSFGVSGQTRADAEVQDRKGRGKGVGEFLETFTARFSAKVLNTRKWMVLFDNLDDEQDQQRAEVRDKKSMSRERDLRIKVTTVRVERELMWNHGEISEQQFEDMELDDGRLPNGLDVLYLFTIEDSPISEWLSLGVEDPTKIENNDPEKMLDKIHDKLFEVSKEIDATRNHNLSRGARQALAALQKLQTLYTEKKAQEEMEELAEAQVEAGIAAQEPTVSPEDEPGEEQAPPGAKPKVDDTRDVPKVAPPNSKPKPETKQTATDFTKELQAELEVILAQYELDFQFLVEEALNEEISRDNFEARLSDLIVAILIAMWLRGANLTLSELTADERDILQQAIDPHLDAVNGIGNDLYSGKYQENTPAALTRIFVWSNMAAGVYFLGLVNRRDDPKLEWVRDPQKDSCADCVRLNGQVHTAREWIASGFSPRSVGLECRGFNCGCSFKETTSSLKGGF